MATARTALELTPKELGEFRAGQDWEEAELEARWREGYEVARAAARLLRERFAATRVAVFGSLVKRACFTPWSDVDLAVWGIPPDQFYRAVAAVTGLTPSYEVDLVDVESCRPGLRQVIEREGIDL